MKGFYDVSYFSGGVCYRRKLYKNDIFNEGEFFFMAPILIGSVLPASAYYIGLMSSALISMPPASATLADVITYEISSSNPGYSIRQQVNRDNTGLGWQLTISGGIWVATSPSLTFHASAAWNQTVAWAFLTTTPTPGDPSGKLISMAPIDVTTPAKDDDIRLTYLLSLR